MGVLKTSLREFEIERSGRMYSSIRELADFWKVQRLSKGYQ